MTDEELIARLRMIHEWKLGRLAADRIEALVKERDRAWKVAHAATNLGMETEAKLAKAVEALKSAEAAITLEINPSNYDHDQVCQLNDETVEAVLILRAALAELESK